MKIDPYQRQICSQRNLLSGGIRLTRMFIRVAWHGASNAVGSPKMRFLVISCAYIVGTFTAKANITIQQHEVPYRVSDDPKMLDLE